MAFLDLPINATKALTPLIAGFVGVFLVGTFTGI